MSLKLCLAIVLSMMGCFVVDAQQVWNPDNGNELKKGLGLPWTGNRFALFNFTMKTGGVDGYADFNWFRFTNK